MMKRFLRRYLRWPLGVRAQLTLWYTVAFAILIPVCGFLLYHDVQDSLVASLDATMAIRTQQLAMRIGYTQGNVRIDARASGLPDFTSERHTQLVNAQAATGPWVRLLDAHGHVVYVTPAFVDLSPPSLSVTQALHGMTWQGNVTSTQGQDIRVYSQLLTASGKPFAVLQVGESLAGVYHTLRRMAEDLLALGFVVLLVSAVGSYWLASRAFAPIGHLTRTARAIKAGDLHQRVPIPRAQDEVYFLALTLNEMIEYLDQAFTRQRRFVADASHELRTPVAAIKSKADLALLQVPAGPDPLVALRDIRLEAGRLSRLISDLLALARGDEGQTRFGQEQVRLDVLVNMVAENASPLASERQITLRVEAPEPVTFQGDEARLIQVAMNLLDNALHYTDAGGQVTLAVGIEEGKAHLRVCDTGRGIAPEHLPHIFERFYRGDHTHMRIQDGQCGLGLSIVAWVVQAHGGEVTVQSQVGKGSSFMVSLPLTEAGSVVACPVESQR